jgi:hypothetical protein
MAEISNERIQLVKAGLNRFYSEGYTKWSEENLTKIFAGVLKDDEIEFLYMLEKKGYVELIKDADCFIRVLRRIDEA